MRRKTPLQKMSRMMSLILLLAALPFAVTILERKLNPQRKVASDQETATTILAADHDLSEASPEEFKKAFKYQILKEASLVRTNAGPGISLGLFLTKNESGNKVFVCDEYPLIDLIFAAEGVAFSGDIPQMVVRGPCQVSADQRHIEALPIPFSKILASPLSQYEFQSEIPGSREKVQIYFRNAAEFWPLEWTWVGVKLYGKNPENTLQINGYEVISVIGEPLTVKASDSNE